MSDHHTSITTTVSGVSITYELHYDLSGNIHYVHTPFFDLPEIARRLQSSYVPEFSRRVENWGQLIQYGVLLGLEGKSLVAMQGVRGLADEIRAKNAAAGTDWLTEFKQSRLGKAAAWYRFCSGLDKQPASARVQQPFHQHLNTVLAFSEQPNNELYTAIRYLGYTGGVGGQALLSLLLPFLPANARRLALEEFQREPSFETRSLLLRELAVPNNQAFVSGILKGLQPYRDKKVIAMATEWFQSCENPTEDALYNFAELLEKAPLAEAEPHLMQIFSAHKRYSSGRAAQSLVKLGVDQDALLTSILPALRSEDTTVTEGAFAILLRLKQAKLPPLSELWDMFAVTTRRRSNLNIIYGFPSLLRRMGPLEVQNYLEAGLTDDSANLRYATMILVNVLRNDNKFSLHISEGMIEAIYQGQFSDHQKEREEAARVMAELLPRERYSTYLDDTVAAYEERSRNTIYRLNILRAWGTLAQRYGFDARTLDICKEAANNQRNYNFRVAAVQVLLYAQDPEVAALLQRMKDDPHEDVRRRLKGKSPLVLGGIPMDDLQKMIKDETSIQEVRKELARERAATKAPDPATLRDNKKPSWLQRLGDWFK
ncbi:MAG: hypothetical protein AAF828_07215 [Bacteroidota bacterium]